MFPFGTRRSAKRATRRGLSQLAKLLKAPSNASGKRAAAAKPRKEPVRKPPGRFVEIRQLRVHYIVKGRGRPVVLVHGNGTMAEDFLISGLIERLATHYRVIAIDRPGFGYTGRPRAKIWTAAEQAELIHHVLAGLKVKRPLVVGHSWGTLVALALAASGLRELRGLVLLSGYYYPSRRADVTMSKTLAMPGIGDAARAMMNPAMGRLVAAQSFRHAFRPEMVPRRFETDFPVEIAMSATQLRAATEDASTMNAAAKQLQHTYARLELPVAILSGSADAVVDLHEQSRRLHGEIGGSSLKILPGLGHMIHYAGIGPIGRAIDTLMSPASTGGQPARRSAASALSPRST